MAHNQQLRPDDPPVEQDDENQDAGRRDQTEVIPPREDETMTKTANDEDPWRKNLLHPPTRLPQHSSALSQAVFPSSSQGNDTVSSPPPSNNNQGRSLWIVQGPPASGRSSLLLDLALEMAAQTPCHCRDLPDPEPNTDTDEKDANRTDPGTEQEVNRRSKVDCTCCAVTLFCSDQQEDRFPLWCQRASVVDSNNNREKKNVTLPEQQNDNDNDEHLPSPPVPATLLRRIRMVHVTSYMDVAHYFLTLLGQPPRQWPLGGILIDHDLLMIAQQQQDHGENRPNNPGSTTPPPVPPQDQPHPFQLHNNNQSNKRKRPNDKTASSSTSSHDEDWHLSRIVALWRNTAESLEHHLQQSEKESEGNGKKAFPITSQVMPRMVCVMTTASNQPSTNLHFLAATTSLASGMHIPITVLQILPSSSTRMLGQGGGGVQPPIRIWQHQPHGLPPPLLLSTASSGHWAGESHDDVVLSSWTVLPVVGGIRNRPPSSSTMPKKVEYAVVRGWDGTFRIVWDSVET